MTVEEVIERLQRKRRYVLASQIEKTQTGKSSRLQTFSFQVLPFQPRQLIGCHFVAMRGKLAIHFSPR